MCQRIQPDGTRCKNPSKILHHLIDPDAPGGLDKFLSADNAVMLCEHCHPGGTAGTPDWSVGRTTFPLLRALGSWVSQIRIRFSVAVAA